MRIFLGLLTLCLVTTAVSRGAAMPDLPFTKLQLRDGTTVTGALVVRPRGLYLSTDVGGKLYPWLVVDPASLPEEVRTAHRGALLVQLAEAQARYEQQDVPGAAPVFALVYRERAYLTEQDRQLPAYQNIVEKSRGLVRDNDQWVTFAQHQAALGLTQIDGQWRTAAEAEQIRAFKAAFAAARAAAKPEDAIVVLKQVMARYPTSPYNDVAKLLIERLVEHTATTASTTAAPAPAATPAAPETPYVRDRTTSSGATAANEAAARSSSGGFMMTYGSGTYIPGYTTPWAPQAFWDNNGHMSWIGWPTLSPGDGGHHGRRSSNDIVLK